MVTMIKKITKSYKKYISEMKLEHSARLKPTRDGVDLRWHTFNSGRDICQSVAARRLERVLARRNLFCQLTRIMLGDKNS